MTDSESLESLRARRKTLKTSLTKLETKLESYPDDNPNFGLVEAHSVRLSEIWNDLTLNHYAILGHLKTQQELDAQESDYGANESRVTDLRAKLFSVPRTTPQSSPRSRSTPPPEPKPTEVRLPTMDLPTFSGQLQDWMSFRDLFTATIRNNKTLAAAQKLQYLKSCLRGDASRIVQSKQVTDNNFAVAWDMLKQRYEHSRELVFAHLRRLINQPLLQSESANGLRELVDTTKECIRSLEILKQPTEHWDAIIVFLTLQKLDGETRRLWELSLTNNEVPEFSSLLTFLEQHAQALNSIHSNKGKINNQPFSKQNHQQRNDRANAKSHHVTNDSKDSKSKCNLCDGAHPYFKCSTFMALSTPERMKLAKERKLCLNCLRPNHFVAQCPSESSCKNCVEKHHTFLHFEKAAAKPQEQPVQSNFASSNDSSQVLLATAVVKVKDGYGKMQFCRAFLDPGSQASFITNSCVNRLHIPRVRIDMSISGLAATAIASAKHYSSLTVISCANERISFNVDAINLPQVTGLLPNLPCESSEWEHISTLKLADPEFDKPGQIDILLGAEVWSEVVLPSLRHGPPNSPVAQETKLGWILLGKANSSKSPSVKLCSVVSHPSIIDVDKTLQRFWELEDTESARVLTNEEQLCEEHFSKTHHRDAVGRYVVRLPFRESLPLGNSRTAALRRFKYIERKLEVNNELKLQYHRFMQEYIDLGHMSPVPTSKLNITDCECFYLPHHCVLKESSTTTKLRVVFDGSAKSSSGVSLNEKLMVGPVVQDGLWAILLRFRMHIIALVGDLVKMYRQIMVDTKDVNFQRILWRFSPSDPIQEFQLLTVTYGTASAPYLATKVLQQLANDEHSTLPLAAEVMKTDFGVDDLMSGETSVSTALELQSQLIELARRGGFQFQKWVSNSPEILQAVPKECRGTEFPLTIDTDESIKALGLRWNPASDTFSFIVQNFDFDRVLTKRSILSDIARIYDPAGWLSCVTVSAKILMQRMWLLKLSWDDPINSDVAVEWGKYREKLKAVESVNIPRCIIPGDVRLQELHGFCDSSEKAFAAALYIRTVTTNEEVHMHLLTSKTKVAPLKQVSLPRLELCGAVLLTRLIISSSEALHKTFDSVHAWSDSKTVLDWIRSPPQRWKTFVANRVAEIQNCKPLPHWHHIPGKSNPADLGSRGILPTEIRDNTLWWTGPPEFQLISFTPTCESGTGTEEALTEERKVIITSTATNTFELIHRFSSLISLKRIAAYLLRFKSNLLAKLAGKERQIGFLTASELNNAFLTIIRQEQMSNFADEIKMLQANQEVSNKSKLKCLNPFLDSNNLLRVGGRLRNSALPGNQKHPLVLPSHSSLTTLIVRDAHYSHLHAGPQLMLQALRQNYWILNGKNTVKYFYRKCVICFRQNATTSNQLMGDLPSARVTPSPAFSKCGVDFAGPFLLRAIKGRGQKRFKAYVSLFICFTTRAIHLELVSDLSTPAFIAALKRFIGRRGKPIQIFSDCGTNFIGADRELRELQKLTTSAPHNNSVTNILSEKGIDWVFNPPSAPHFGGLWEAGVKSMKHHLRRIVGNEVLNFEEMTTVLVEIEACLNSRPLCPLSEDPNDFTALTPGHFLIGRPLTAIPEPGYSEVKSNRLSRWQLAERVVQHFWTRWTSEYLSRLQHRPKWMNSHPNIEVNNLVLLKDERLPKLQWKLGRVIIVHPGQDKKVRVVSVKTMEGVFKRPITKVCLLPIDTTSTSPEDHF